MCDNTSDQQALDREVGEITRTYSLPDIYKRRRVKVFGFPQHSRKSWYRKGTLSHWSSLYRLSPTQQTKFSLWSINKHEKALLFCVTLTDLCAMMCMSVMAPFFPGEAEEKGVSLMMAGWVFGVFALTEFLFAPICGKMVSVVSPRFMFLAGQFFSGSCYILFGVMQYVPATPDDHTVYLTLCIVLRVFTAMGCSATTTSSFVITATAFPEHIGTVFGLLETSTGLGMSVGPALGGLLYDVGGFVLPFVSLGAFMVLMSAVSKCLLPPIDTGAESTSTSIFYLLTVPAIFTTVLCVFLSAVVWSVLDPTLQPHLMLVDGYNLSSSLIGLIFLLFSAVYGICCPLLGVLCDHIEDTSPLLVVGFLLAGAATLLLGPSPHLGFPSGYNVLWLNLVALILIGAALAFAIVPTFDKILDAADKAGVDDSLEMYGVVAGLWGSAYAFGDFVGPSVGGFLAERYGFALCMTYIGYTCWGMALCCFLLCLYERICGPTQPVKCCATVNSKNQKQTEDGKKIKDDIPSTSTVQDNLNDEETQPLLDQCND